MFRTDDGSRSNGQKQWTDVMKLYFEFFDWRELAVYVFYIYLCEIYVK